MYTFQDLQAVINKENQEQLITFIRTAIDQHKSTERYKIASVADQYNRHKNVTINNYQKLLYKVTGEVVPDNFSADFKMACRHFHRFITQENQFLLGNGVTWQNEDTADKLGTEKYPFNTQLQSLGLKALWGGVAFGFFNLDHLEIFSILEFAPLFDEEDGAMKAGIRFWQVASDKPLRATLYELDGYTEYIWKEGKGEILKDKRPYKLKIRTSEIDGTEIYDGENYPSFPIVPLWANDERQSEIVGLREQIDCYDLIKSGFANTVDESSLIYWTISNAGGMDDVDLAEFLRKVKTVHAYNFVDEGAQAESHQLDTPYQSREALLERLDRDLYRDAMALDTQYIAGGNITATQIKAAYEPLNSKTDSYEFCVIDFINDILMLAGVEDKPTFTRSIIVNAEEEMTMLLQSAQYLSEDYVTKRILALFGDSDLADDMLKEMDKEALNRFVNIEDNNNNTEEENNNNDNEEIVEE